MVLSYTTRVDAAPQSRTAHMSDGRYYKRYDGQSIPMEDYEVRDTMRRNATPDVRLRLRNHPTDSNEVFLEIRNFSPTPASYFALSVLFGPSVSVDLADGIFQAGTVKFGGVQRAVVVDGVEQQFSEWRYEWWNRMPLFEADWERLTLAKLGSLYPGATVVWYVEGPGMYVKGAYRVPQQVIPYRLKPADEILWDLPARA